MAKSYFEILGISPDATPNEIRRAYRRLAKEFHPDHFEGGSRKFREIQEAYSVLGNDRKRQKYRQLLRKSSPQRMQWSRGYYRPEPLIPNASPVGLRRVSPAGSLETLWPLFEENFDSLWGDLTGFFESKSGQVLEVHLTPAQARRGGHTRVMVPIRTACPSCDGHGGIGLYECGRCAGRGILFVEKPVTISYPPGVTEDYAVVIPLRRFGMRLKVLFRMKDRNSF